jgi:hypothetical protein
MGINDIKLPEFIIGEWYGENLLPSSKPAVAPPPPKPAVAPTPPKPAVAPTPPKPTASAASATAPAPPPFTRTTASSAPQPPTLKYLGSNRRHITLLVNAPGIPFLPDNQLAFLTKILEACHMTIADVAIVNNAATPATITTIKEQLQPTTLLLFGVDPTAIRLPINFPILRQMDYDACTYLSAPGLDQLVPNSEESKLLKSKLWVCLKTIFNV